MKSDTKSRRVKAPSPQVVVNALGLFHPQIFQTLRPHGNTKWLLHVLAAAAVTWAWSVEPTLVGRYEAALSTLARWFPASFVATTYQGFIKALATWSAQLLPLLVRVFQARMQGLPNAWTIGRWMCFAIDGTKIELPWTAAHEAVFGLPAVKSKRVRRKRGRKGKVSANSLAHQDVRPQAFVTLLWHLASGLPWAWRVGPVGASERDALRELLSDLPPRALVIGDAGFNGYELWRAILAGGRHFVIRVGSNITLLTKLGCVRTAQNVVYLWPDAAQRRRQPPLVLRLVRFCTARTTVCLVTDLTPGQLSDRQAAELYRRRWGIEGFFRGFKQTFRRRKLLSESPAQARCELDWSLVGLWLACLTAVEELVRAGESPHRMSVAGVLRAIRRVCGRDLPRAEWRQLLRRAVKDGYRREASKRARHSPRKKLYKPCGEPEIRPATPAERRAAREILAARRVA